MNYYNDTSVSIEKMRAEGSHSCTVLDETNGCVSGCRAGFTFHNNTEYNKGGVHDDQEGFLVMEGYGKALFGEQEFDLFPGQAMIAPKGVKHQIKKNADSPEIKIFWFHSAVV